MIRIVLASLSLATLPAASGRALEPLAGPGNYAAVCRALGDVYRAALRLNTAAASAGSDERYSHFQTYQAALWPLGFSAETRATVDADDLDELLGAAEAVALTPGTPVPEIILDNLRMALQDFAKAYRCRIVE